MSSDDDCISQTLGTSHHMPGQVSLSDQLQRTSESELDISGLVNESDLNFLRSDRDVHFKWSKSAYPGHVSGQSDPTGDHVSQSDINKEILALIRGEINHY